MAVLLPPSRAIDKPANSAFSRPNLVQALRAQSVTPVVVTGSETDVCVLATVMAAVDLGFQIVLPTDALCSTSEGTHNALLKLYRGRFRLQIEATTTEDVQRCWNG